MKNFYILLFVGVFHLQASNVFSEESAEKVLSLTEKDSLISSYNIAEVTVLGENKDKNITVRAVKTDLGMSTDVSPRYGLYLTFYHAGESVNSGTSFYLGKFLSVDSYKRVKAGVYEIVVKNMDDQGDIQEKVLTLDTEQVFLDDIQIRKSAEELSDIYFNSSVSVSFTTLVK